MPGLVHSGSAGWDDCGQMFPDKLCVGLFPDGVPHYARTAQSDCSVKGVFMLRCNLPPALLAEWPGSYMYRFGKWGWNGHCIRLSTQSCLWRRKFCYHDVLSNLPVSKGTGAVRTDHWTEPLRTWEESKCILSPPPCCTQRWKMQSKSSKEPFTVCPEVQEVQGCAVSVVVQLNLDWISLNLGQAGASDLSDSHYSVSVSGTVQSLI